MWWDMLRYFGNNTDKKVINEMYLALEKILWMDSTECQGAALHGLGHIEHPKKEQLVTKYLRERPNLHHDIRIYALACIEGNVL
jgi:hypothetical protein